jgi:hypothetical protein
MTLRAELRAPEVDPDRIAELASDIERIAELLESERVQMRPSRRSTRRPAHVRSGGLL